MSHFITERLCFIKRSHKVTSLIPFGCCKFYYFHFFIIVIFKTIHAKQSHPINWQSCNLSLATKPSLNESNYFEINAAKGTTLKAHVMSPDYQRHLLPRLLLLDKNMSWSPPIMLKVRHVATVANFGDFRPQNLGYFLGRRPLSYVSIPRICE